MISGKKHYWDLKKMVIKPYKICVFGNAGVGRTSLIRTFAKIIKNPFKSDIWQGIIKLSLRIKEDEIKLFIFDLPTYVKFNVLYNPFFKGANGGIFVYDFSNRKSLEDIDLWMKRFKDGNDGNINEIPIIIIGNKIDKSDNKSVFEKNFLKITQKYHILEHFKCSSKTGENVENAFMMLINKINQLI